MTKSTKRIDKVTSYQLKNGDYHREDGPAYIQKYTDGTCAEHWIVYGKYHRYGGPAITGAKCGNEYWVYGNNVTNAVEIWLTNNDREWETMGDLEKGELDAFMKKEFAYLVDAFLKNNSKYLGEDFMQKDITIDFQKSSEKDKKITSNGGSSEYYDIPEHATELHHLISHKEMSFNRGNMFKALYRLGEKDGTDVEYDLNKIEYFLNELREMVKRGEKI